MSKRALEEEEDDVVVVEKKEALMCCVCMETVRQWPHEGRLCLPSMGMHWICISCSNTQKKAGASNPLDCPLCKAKMDQLGTARVLTEFVNVGKRDNSQETFEELKLIWTRHSECLLHFVMYTQSTVGFPPLPYFGQWANQRFVKWIFEQLYQEDPSTLLTWFTEKRLCRQWIFRQVNAIEFDHWLLMESPFQQVIISTDKLGPNNIPYVLTAACVRGDRRKNINLVAEWYERLNIPIRTRVKDLLRALANSRLSDPQLLNLVWAYFTNGHDVNPPDIIQEMGSLSKIHEQGLDVIGRSLSAEVKRVLWPMLGDLVELSERQILSFITHWRPPGGTVGKHEWYKTIEGSQFVRSIFAHADGRVVVGPESRVHTQSVEQEALQGQKFFFSLEDHVEGVYSVKLTGSNNLDQLPIETINCQLKPTLFLVCRPGHVPIVGLSALADLNHIQTCDDFDTSSVFSLYHALDDTMFRFVGFATVTVLSS